VSTSLNIAVMVVAIALIAAILLQAKGSGLGSVFGGDGAVFRTRRGAEKGLFNLTIVLAVLFCVLSILNVIFSRTAL
jgi:preprotein translocase subunit SecG